MFFIESNDYHNDIEVEFEEELFDIEAKYRVFYSEYLIDGPENDYDGFNFTDHIKWDQVTNSSFWYDSKNKILLKTVDFIIGRNTTEKAHFGTIPQRWIFE